MLDVEYEKQSYDDDFYDSFDDFEYCPDENYNNDDNDNSSDFESGEPEKYIHPYFDNVDIQLVSNDKFLENYTKIDNFGQHNLGVFVNESAKKIIIATLSLFKTGLQCINYLEKQNIHIYPKYYNVYSYNKQYYVEWDLKLGDVTSLLCKTIPQIVFNQMKLTNNQYLVKLIPTSKYKINNDIKNIDDNEYSLFLENINKVYASFWSFFADTVKSMKLKLLKYGFFAGDDKFDNMVYEFSDNLVENSFPIILNGETKFVKLYFIDIESNLSKIKYVEDVEREIFRLNNDYEKTKFTNYSIFGQYNFVDNSRFTL